MSFSLYSLNNANSCFSCKKAFEEELDVQFSGCGHTFHNACWEGACKPCDLSKKRKAEQISQENWGIVKTTSLVFFAVYALFVLKKT